MSESNMPVIENPDVVIDVEARVRQSAGSAGLTAGLLIFFGFFYFGGPNPALSGDTLFHYTLRLGGIAMAIIAVGTSIGVPVALLADAGISFLIGLCLSISGILLTWSGGWGLNYALYSICGIAFIVSAVRGWGDYRRLPLDAASTDTEELDDSGMDVSDISDVQDDAGATVALRRQMVQLDPSCSGSSAAFVASDAEPIVFDRQKPIKAKRPASMRPEEDLIRLDDTPPAPATPAPEGFLAELAKKTPPKS